MTGRIPVTVQGLRGDDAEITTPTGIERYRAADIAVALGVSVGQLPQARLTARRDSRGRLYDWAPAT
ncbi:hypothetical protein [Streptomyces sp. NPDC126503]|uniref:hypothetical protein n=1 Tax=Streptomyces sp. NPDC126503 TaxID=3155315 RepID=UPI00331A6EDD